MQACMAHPTDESFKQMVSRKTLDNCSLVAVAAAAFDAARMELRVATLFDLSLLIVLG